MKFKLNDWVKTVNGDLIKLKKDWMVEQANTTKRHLIVPATDAEVRIRWWAKNDRELWELKRWDVVHNYRTGKDETIKLEFSNNFGTFYETCEGNLLKKGNLKHDYKVVCFVHERRDIIPNKKN